MKLILENWRKFLIEQEEQEEIKATTNDIPDEMYHATRPPLVPSIMIDGITDYSGQNRNGITQPGQGVSLTTSLEPLKGGNFGNAILVIDGSKMKTSEQYELTNYQDPQVDTPEHEVRVRMKDTASASGSGIDPKVDALGTSITPQYIKGICFVNQPQKFEVKHMKQEFPGLELSYIDDQGQKIVLDDKELNKQS